MHLLQRLTVRCIHVSQALMFNKNPAFQLSVALLVMFASYAAQVRNRPYMSMSEREQVLEDHARKAQKGDKVHMALRANLLAIKARGRRAAHRRMSWGGNLMAK